MPRRLQQIVLALAIVAMSYFAHRPLFESGCLWRDAADWHAVADTTEPRGSLRSLWADQGEIRPLAAASLRGISALQGGVSLLELEGGLLLRCASWILLLGTATALGFALRRVLLPWTGSSSAGAAGWACALFVACHPLSVPAVARVSAHAWLACTFLAACSAALFLRARQDRSQRALIASGLCALLAAFTSSLSLLLPPILVLLEFGSGRRPRPGSARVRTALVTAVAFTALVALEPLIAWLLGLAGRQSWSSVWPQTPEAHDLSETALWGVEKLGVVFLPVAGPLGAVPYVLSGALVLLALQPVLRAMRSAPRLWGWLFLAWIALVCLALLPLAGVRTAPGDFSRAEILFPAAAFVCAGLASGATALSGTRRVVLPLLVGLGFAWLAQQSARAWPVASLATRELRGDLLAALHGAPPDTRVWVVDPSASVAGLELPVGELTLLTHDSVLARASPRSPSEPLLCTLSSTALFCALRMPEIAEDRERRLVLLLPQALLRAPAPEVRASGRVIWPVPARSVADAQLAPVFWRGDGRSPLIDIDPLRYATVRAEALAGASTAEAPRMGWRASESRFENGSIDGAWLFHETGAIAVFDLSRSLDWALARGIRRVWMEGALSTLVSAEILHGAGLPLRGALAPVQAGGDWAFELEGTRRPMPIRGEPEWWLVLFDRATLAASEFQAADPRSARLLFVGAAEWSGTRAAGAVDWWLECRLGATCVARTGGRL
jgi:hypothetical protein